MNDFEVTFRPAAVRDLSQLAPGARDEVVAAVGQLGSEFRPQGSKRLRFRPGYSLDVAEVRVLYPIDVEQRVVRVVAILEEA